MPEEDNFKITKNMDNFSDSPIKYLQKSKDEILDYLRKIVRSRDFNYRTFGTAIEEHLSDVLVKFLTDGGYIKGNNDYELASNKNFFPDFILKSTPQLAVEYKTGNRSQCKNGKWISVKNSNNDMGTLSEWPKKIDKFGGENIYYIFVIYNFNEKVKEVIEVKIAPFYEFMGVNSGKVLKYREKDGNLRPKDFDAVSPITNYNQFNKLLNKTIIYRSKRIVIKHRKIIKNITEELK